MTITSTNNITMQDTTEGFYLWPVVDCTLTHSGDTHTETADATILVFLWQVECSINTLVTAFPLGIFLSTECDIHVMYSMFGRSWGGDLISLRDNITK